MRIQKGMIISTDNFWYVVVNTKWDAEKKELLFECICDNANNRYSFSAPEVHAYMTLEEIGQNDWVKPERKLLKDRKIPHDVIVEVLSGKHDDRFDDRE